MADVHSSLISSLNVVMSRGMMMDTSFSLLNSDIAKQELDVIVNTTNPSLDLMNAGGVSKAIATAGGAALLEECKKKYPKGFTTGEVAVTGVHGLPALKAIYHVYLVGWDESAKDKITEDLRSTLKSIMKKATDIGMESIGLPAIGSGLNMYPPDTVAEVILDEVTRFVDFNPDTTVRKVVFVVHESNQPVIKAFLQKFSSYRWSDQQELTLANLEVQDNQDTPSTSGQAQFLSNMGQSTSALLVEVTPGTPEYADVLKNLPVDEMDIIKIQRVVNQSLKVRYAAYKSRIPGNANERTLFYGAKPANLRRIKEHGFECDRPDTRMFEEFGKGQCFALDPSYPLSPGVSPPDQNNERCIIQCKVVTGKHAEGNGDTTAPPVGCHSTVNDVNDPNWFVVYDSDASYPEFIITFRDVMCQQSLDEEQTQTQVQTDSDSDNDSESECQQQCD